MAEDDERWYPADKLWIVDWQPVRRKLDDDEGEGMVDIATRNPEQNRDLILTDACPLLGIGETIRKVSASGHEVPSLLVGYRTKKSLLWAF